MVSERRVQESAFYLVLLDYWVVGVGHAFA